MNKILVSLLLLSMSCTPNKEKPKVKTILVVLAHPDDEDAIGALLVKYGRANKVYLVIATDGRLGTRPGFPTGDSLVNLRQIETKCACQTMGIEPPVFLGFSDGFDTRNGVGEYMLHSKSLKEKLTRLIQDLNPDAIITFGPDGDTGHSDHRMISNMTTEIILKEGWVERFPLYYLGWTKKDSDKLKMIGGLNTVDPKYLNVSIQFTDEDERQAMKALECYKSQLSPDDMKAWAEMEKNDSSNTFYFRQLEVSTAHKTDF